MKKPLPDETQNECDAARRVFTGTEDGRRVWAFIQRVYSADRARFWGANGFDSCPIKAAFTDGQSSVTLHLAQMIEAGKHFQHNEPS